MTTNRQKFTVEFKRDAATLVVEQGYSVQEACRAMG
jgi:transposase